MAQETYSSLIPLMAVAAAGLAGIPPISGFASKCLLGLGTMEKEDMLSLLVLIASGLLNAAYFFPVSIHRCDSNSRAVRKDIALTLKNEKSMINLFGDRFNEFCKRRRNVPLSTSLGSVVFD